MSNTSYFVFYIESNLVLIITTDNNNLRLIMVKTNRSTLHTVYNIQQSTTQGSNDTTHKTVTQDSNNQV